MIQSTTPRIKLSDVENVLPLKSWWAIVAVLPFVRRLTVLVVNYTTISANAITIISILLRLVAAAFFVQAVHEWLIVGALSFYVAYLLDCMDGAVARLRNQSTEFGRFLDHMGDLTGGLVTVAALSFGQGMLFTALIAGLLFCHIIEYYVSYLTSTILSCRAGDYYAPQGMFNSGIVRMYSRYRAFFHARNIKSFFSFPDYEAVTFFVFPLLGLPVIGLKIGFCMALMVTLYTVLSTFVAIHANSNKFP